MVIRDFKITISFLLPKLSQILHSVPRIVALVGPRACANVCLWGPCMGPWWYSCQPKQVFKDCALICFDFLQVKNWANKLNMQIKLSYWNIDYEGRNPWHTQYINYHQLSLQFWGVSHQWGHFRQRFHIALLLMDIFSFNKVSSFFYFKLIQKLRCLWRQAVKGRGSMISWRQC